MLSFENVGLRYGVSPETLRDITFEIAPHSFQFLTGPSGAGKTTLMRLIIMALKPTRGIINIFGKDTQRAESGRSYRNATRHWHRVSGFSTVRSPHPL